MRGGPGRDTVSYADYVVVQIALGGQAPSGPARGYCPRRGHARGRRGRRGRGGAGTIVGSPGDNRLVGGEDHDTTRGGRGTWARAPTVRGGPGLRPRHLWGPGRRRGRNRERAGRRLHPGDGDGGRRRRQRRQGHRAPHGRRRERHPDRDDRKRRPPPPTDDTTFVFGAFTVTVEARLAGGPGDDSLQGVREPTPSSAAPASTRSTDSTGTTRSTPAATRRPTRRAAAPAVPTSQSSTSSTRKRAAGTQIAAVGRHPTVTIPRAPPTRGGCWPSRRLPARRGGRLPRDARGRAGIKTAACEPSRSTSGAPHAASCACASGPRRPGACATRAACA